MTPVIPSKNTVVALHRLHPPPLDLVLPLIFDYQPKHTFVLNRTLFAQLLTIVPHLSSSGLFGMVYEHLLICFIPENSSSWFSKLFQVTVVVTRKDIPRSMAIMLGANRLLPMAKDISGFRLIAVGEMFI
jgi:hypothetical protein